MVTDPQNVAAPRKAVAARDPVVRRISARSSIGSMKTKTARSARKSLKRASAVSVHSREVRVHLVPRTRIGPGVHREKGMTGRKDVVRVRRIGRAVPSSVHPGIAKTVNAQKARAVSDLLRGPRDGVEVERAGLARSSPSVRTDLVRKGLAPHGNVVPATVKNDVASDRIEIVDRKAVRARRGNAGKLAVTARDRRRENTAAHSKVGLKAASRDGSKGALGSDLHAAKVRLVGDSVRKVHVMGIDRDVAVERNAARNVTATAVAPPITKMPPRVRNQLTTPLRAL